MVKQAYYQELCKSYITALYHSIYKDANDLTIPSHKASATFC